MSKLFVFDLDGTLIDTRKDIANSVNYVLEEYGLPGLSLEQVTAAVGGGIEKLMQRCVGEAYPSEKIKRAKLLKKFRKYYRIHCTDYSRPYSGVVQFLQNKNPQEMAILSNKPEAFCRLILKRLKLDHHFNIIVGGDTTREKKPEPAGLQFVLDNCLREPADCVMVGDSDADVLVAKRLKVFSVGIEAGMGNTQALRESSPDVLITDFSQLRSQY